MQRRYKRYFVMLETEEKGLNISNKEKSKGYAKIEITNGKGTLTINCQNLNIRNKGDRHRWYLINTNKDPEPQIVEVGPMEIDDKGKGEVIWEFNTRNVRGSMEDIESFNTLVLVAQNKENQSTLVAPLVGYIDKKKTSWRYALERHLYIKPMAEYTEEEKIEKELDQEKDIDIELDQELHQELDIELEQEIDLETEVELPKEKTEENIELEPGLDVKIQEEIELKVETTQEELAEPICEESIEKIAEPMLKQCVCVDCKCGESPSEECACEKLAKDKALQEEDIKVESFEKDYIEKPTLEEFARLMEESYVGEIIRPKEVDYTEEIIKPMENNYTEETDENYYRQLQGYIDNILKDFPEVDPFINNLKRSMWWQIPYDKQTMYRSYMPFILYLDSNEHIINHSNSQILGKINFHKHHIFGIAFDEDENIKHYIYGVPGKNTILDQPYKGSTGFTHWHPSDLQPYDEDSHGYWLAYIDSKTGKITLE